MTHRFAQSCNRWNPGDTATGIEIAECRAIVPRTDQPWAIAEAFGLQILQLYDDGTPVRVGGADFSAVVAN